ncbi:RNase H domain-containing protein [Trichonephila clavipes]|nr:RNase H domain-containing protein [Trichonephila clavipes]
MEFSEGRKSFEMCTNCSSEPDTPVHILECLGLTKQDLADVPSLVLDFLKVYDVMDLTDRGSRNSSWQGARSTPGLGLEHHTGDSTNYLGEIPRRDDRWRHHLSPPPQFRHGTEGGGKYSLVPCTRDSAHKTFGPTDLTSTYSVCTRGGFGGLGHRTHSFRSGVRCSKH